MRPLWAANLDYEDEEQMSDNNDLDISKLLGKTLEIIRMDVNNIYKDAVAGKLGPAAARDVVNYMKALKEAEIDQKAKALEAAKLEAARQAK